jgi:hypothetical protein
MQLAEAPATHLKVDNELAKIGISYCQQTTESTHQKRDTSRKNNLADAG